MSIERDKNMKPVFSYICDKFNIDENDAEIISYKRDKNIPLVKTSVACRVRDNRFVIIEAVTTDDTELIISQLECYMLYGCSVRIISKPNTEDEMITEVSVADAQNVNMLDYSALEAPAVLIVENPSPKRLLKAHINDDEFVQNASAPMIDDDTRNKVINALDMVDNSILYDIGAGNGALAVEASLISHDTAVYAFEKNDTAITVINENRRKFGCDNIWQIKADAPYCIDVPPVPTHAFIGGSGGHLIEIVDALLKRNSAIRIIIKGSPSETAAELMKLSEKYENSILRIDDDGNIGPISSL